ncbi:MAG: efflux RND transporter periplasmic adaptor subunit [Ruminococcus sp.]|jgi:HlyD family secretion protein|nr:efflux RND transporter periplasmic adaptor subunit [Ruminococcus sp.]
MNKKALLRTAAVLSISATLLYSTVSCGVSDLMNMPNTTYTLEHTDVENFISVTGKVEGSNVVKVTSEVATKVKTLNVGIGSNVKEGDVLCVFDSSSFQEEYDKLKESSDMANEKSDSMHTKNAKALESAKSDKTEQLKQAQRVIDNAVSAKDRTQTKCDEAYDAMNEAYDAGNYELYATKKAEYDQYSEAVIQCDSAIQDAKDAYAATEKRCNEAITAAQEMIDNEKYDKDTTIQNQLDKLQESIDKCTVKAPTDGIITALSVAEGSVPTAEAIMTIEDNSKLRINVSINEADILNVAEGQKAVITTSATGEEKFSGKVSRVVNIMSGQKENALTGETSGGGYSAEITIDEGTTNLLIGMSAKVKIIMDQKDDVLAVPYDSIKENDDGTFSVFVAEKNDKGYKAKEFKVQKGMETNYLTEISSSELKDGDLILTDVSAISDGDDVTVAEGYVDPDTTEGD